MRAADERRTGFRMSQLKYRWWVWLILMLAIPLLGFCGYAGSYMLATYQDGHCFAGGGASERRTRARVEACLFAYTKSDCEELKRPKAGNYTGHRCVSYNILGMDSIHVIYAEDDVVIRRISAYE